MKERLRAFVERHPEGWNHDEWMGLLSQLQQDGADVGDPQQVGRALERTRLEWELSRRPVKGLGPKRSEALVARFGTVWGLRQASVDEVAEVPTITRTLAERVVQAMQ
ncbi:MAG TPA: helix-hairpin-helix domain-containing protein [Longimicrobiales bacterium]|nr:helix-hairpin-helix domain-containing protein [Longimicrobiales bacterium]